jgi:ATP synthase mitochondrial F1 complex assembly factor 1
MIWRLRHASNPQSLCAVVPTDVFRSMAAVGKEHPQFVLPLPREEEGAQIHIMQWSFLSPTTASIMFTELAEYKLRQEYSQPHTVVTHHTDLADEKGVVLLEGTVMDGRGVSVEDAKWLLMCLQKFYGQAAENTPRRDLLHKFSRGDAGFKIEELLEEAEKV